MFTFKIYYLMRAKLLILFFFFAGFTTKGQIGLQGHYHTLNSLDEQSTVYNSFTGGLDYWFRLPRVRLEFRPFLGVEHLQSRSSNLSFQGLTFEMQTLFYPMDWFNDCQCPTFGKTNDFIKKGFFLTVAPFASTPISTPEAWDSGAEFIWGLKAGAGLDIGLSDYVTLSPFIRLAYFNDQIIRRADIEKSSSITFQVGILLGLRWDTQNF